VSVSAVDCVQPALQHTRQQLFAPFRFGQWSRLALVAILAGELHVGGCNFGNWGQLASHRRNSGQEFLAPAFPHIDPARIAQFAGLIAVIVFLAVVLFFVFLYINSVFRFILFESVLRKECSIGDGWQRWHRTGRRYFLWQLVLVISTAVFFGMLVGIPLAMMGAAVGSMKSSAGHVAGIAGGAILLIGIVLFCALALIVVQVLARDFLVPIMALEDLDFADAWSRLFGLMRGDLGKYAVYLLLKLVMVIAAWILFSILALIPALAIIGPSVVVIIAGAAAGLTWNVTTVSLVVIFGFMALLLLLYVIALVATPATIFFPAYAMYFFAARYPNLGALLNPTPVPAPPAPDTPPTLEPPPEPPPLPSPEPIG
jgi:hypothetical protein